MTADVTRNRTGDPARGSGVIAAQWGEQGQPGVLRNRLNTYASADPWLIYCEGNHYLAATSAIAEYIYVSPDGLEDATFIKETDQENSNQ